MREGVACCTGRDGASGRQLLALEVERLERKDRESLALIEAHLRQENGDMQSQSPATSGFVCVICYEHRPIGDVFRLAACSCGEDWNCCIKCMREWVEGEIGSQAAGPPPFVSCSF